MANKERLEAVLKHIKEHPETWDQEVWHCDTSHCFAGHAHIMALAEQGLTSVSCIEEDGRLFASLEEAEEEDGPLGWKAEDGTYLYYAREIAIAWLGLEDSTCIRLFDGNNTLEDLESVVSDLTSA